MARCGRPAIVRQRIGCRTTTISHGCAGGGGKEGAEQDLGSNHASRSDCENAAIIGFVRNDGSAGDLLAA
jgi:hypothetical protein